MTEHDKMPKWMEPLINVPREAEPRIPPNYGNAPLGTTGMPAEEDTLGRVLKFLGI